MNYIILAYTNNKLKSKELDLSKNESSTISLQSINGSKGIHLCLEAEDKSIIKQIQIESRPNEIIQVRLQKESDSEHINVSSANTQTTILPPDQFYKPEYGAFLIPENKQIDVLFILDGTMLSLSLDKYNNKETKTHFLLDDNDFSQNLSSLINSFLGAIDSEVEDIRCSFLSFADKSIPKTNAKNLKSQYVLDPESKSDHFFSVWDKDQVTEQINQMRGSSGGDYIDELAEALHVATEDYNWRPEARKLVFIIGDSPGFSIINPAPVIGGIQANAAIRYYDIDSEITHLHRQGIEVMTLYLIDEKLFRSAKGLDKYKLYTQQQYTDLASLNKFSYIWGKWEPKEAAQSFLEKENQLVGRGFCYPVLVES